MSKSREEREREVVDRVQREARESNSEQEKWAKENREDAAAAPESAEEAAERVAVVRRTMLFGDTPTDPTTGDAAVPAHDEEGATVSVAEADAAEGAGDEEAAGQSHGERVRQSEAGLTDEQLVAAEEADTARDPEPDPSQLSATEKVERVKAAESHDELNELAADDDRVTVQRAVEAKRAELDQ